MGDYTDGRTDRGADLVYSRRPRKSEPDSRETATLAVMEDRQKRLLIRARRRGFQEMDLIMGGFAETYGPSLSEADLTAFEALLQAPDQDVYDWLLGRVPPPPVHDTPVLARIRELAGTGLASKARL
jgi:antitoxin CptB